jgi:methionine-rich copper-binding protein CopC
VSRRRWLLLATGAWLAVPAAGIAHSLLLDATPQVGAVLTAPPSRIALRFNNRVEKALCRLTLVSARDGRRPLAVAPDGAPDQVTAVLPPLAPDTYRVQWSVLSTDGHVVTGSYTFQVTR